MNPLSYFQIKLCKYVKYEMQLGKINIKILYHDNNVEKKSCYMA